MGSYVEIFVFSPNKFKSIVWAKTKLLTLSYFESWFNEYIWLFGLILRHGLMN